jgi:hypothetical protein
MYLATQNDAWYTTKLPDSISSVATSELMHVAEFQRQQWYSVDLLYTWQSALVFVITKLCNKATLYLRRLYGHALAWKERQGDLPYTSKRDSRECMS